MTVRRTIPILLVGSCVALLSACGSGSTKTVSVANTTPLVAPSAATTTATNTTSAATASGASQSSATTTTSASGTARTQSAPGFVQTTTSGATGPAAVVVAHGYAPASPSTYNPQNTLQVIIATNQLGLEKAFFFVNGRYIGTDTSAASNSISLVGQSDTEVTLGYALMHPDGSSAGTARVSYALNNGMLSPLDPIPSANPTAPVSRR